MTRLHTLSQSFDKGEFIPSDILVTVDASVRAAAQDILERGGLVGDIDRIIDLRANAPYISDAALSGLVPSMNPDEFMPYEKPKAPVMTGFDEFEPAAMPEEPVLEPEPEAEAAAEPEAEAEEQVIVNVETFDIDVKVPDLGDIEYAAALVEEDISVEMPEVSRFNANLFKVKLDTLRFDSEFLARVRFIAIISVIALANVLLIVYLLAP